MCEIVFGNCIKLDRLELKKNNNKNFINTHASMKLQIKEENCDRMPFVNCFS